MGSGTLMDRYCLEHEVGTRWWGFPWTAYKHNGTLHSKYLGSAMTRWGALQVIRRHKRIKGIEIEEVI